MIRRETLPITYSYQPPEGTQLALTAGTKQELDPSFRWNAQSVCDYLVRGLKRPDDPFLEDPTGQISKVLLLTSVSKEPSTEEKLEEIAKFDVRFLAVMVRTNHTLYQEWIGLGLENKVRRSLAYAANHADSFYQQELHRQQQDGKPLGAALHEQITQRSQVLKDFQGAILERQVIPQGTA